MLKHSFFLAADHCYAHFIIICNIVLHRQNGSHLVLIEFKFGDLNVCYVLAKFILVSFKFDDSKKKTNKTPI